jgi:hypothetical protein
MPSFHSHIFGFVVRRLREMYSAGATADAMMRYLQELAGEDTFLPYRYLKQAFCQKSNVFMYILPPGPTDANTEEGVRKCIEERRPEWESQRFPELLRLRDYFSFLEFARDEHLIVTVCDAPPESSEYVLHGVYDADSGEPAWSGRRGETFRGALNRRLGRELVRAGPLDQWEKRDEPRLPAIRFNHDQQIYNYLNVRQMARDWPTERHWSRLYPDHPVQP